MPVDSRPTTLDDVIALVVELRDRADRAAPAVAELVASLEARMSALECPRDVPVVSVAPGHSEDIPPAPTPGLVLGDLVVVFMDVGGLFLGRVFALLAGDQLDVELVGNGRKLARVVVRRDRVLVAPVAWDPEAPR